MADTDIESVSQLFYGRPASAGFFSGPIFNALQNQIFKRIPGNPEEEKSALLGAIEIAFKEVSTLAAAADDEDIAAILEFQSAFLEDDALSEPALVLVAEGRAADDAFQAIIDEMAGEYEAAEDEYFAARGSDIRDLGTRVLRKLGGENGNAPSLPDGAIYLADDIMPTDFLAHDWKDHALLLRRGSPTAHVSMLARTKGVAMIVGLGDFAAANGVPCLVDGDTGTAIIHPTITEMQEFEDKKMEATQRSVVEMKLRGKPATTTNGEQVSVNINIADISDLEGLAPELCDGIGLVRTELLFHNRDQLPDEEEQYAAYAKILKWAKGKPVTIRTLDAGGDKPITGLTLQDEDNSFLGLRGVRLSLANKAVFMVQLRALLRAAQHGNLHIMIPMVSIPSEMESVKVLLAEAQETLSNEGKSVGQYQLGMMAEVPSVVLTMDAFDVDFVSIGSNDLTQYIMAAGRDSSAVSYLADTQQPAVLAAIGYIVKACKKRTIPVSLCGDAGGDAQLLPMLLEQGLRSFSVSPSALGRAKLSISQWPEAS